MTDYTKLVAALRWCSTDECVPCDGCPMDEETHGTGCFNIMHKRAAAAIEALMDAEKTYLAESAQCHENLRRAAETRRERDERIEALQAQLPKRGQYVHGRELSREYIGDCLVSIEYEDWRCSVCGIVFEQWSIPKYNYCPNCGAKMEVQE